MMPGEVARSSQIRVAVLNQHRLTGEAIGVALQDAGQAVELVTTDWWQVLGHPAMPVDVAVLDLHVEDGVLCATRVLDLSRLGVASVIVGATGDSAALAAAVQAGALGFVATSDPLADLVEAVRAAAAGMRRLDLPPVPVTVDAGLGRQEERALVLYAGGRSIREVAIDMQTTEETIKSYLKRGRRKYRQAGVDIGTRVLLRAHAAREGWVARN